VVLDIPLLLEGASDFDVDAILVVTASADVQRDRVMARPGMSEEKFSAVLRRQIPDDQKRRRAQFLIHTSGQMRSTFRQVRNLIAGFGVCERLA
jgi:dephospho-CoA kinase